MRFDTDSIMDERRLVMARGPTGRAIAPLGEYDRHWVFVFPIKNCTCLCVCEGVSAYMYLK